MGGDPKDIPADSNSLPALVGREHKVGEDRFEALRPRGWVSLSDFCTSVAKISYPTGQRWAKLGMINTVHVGGKLRIYEEEIVRFMRFGTLPPDEEKVKEYRKTWRENREKQKQKEQKK